MTQAELITALKSLKLPVAYSAFEGDDKNPAPQPPFITVQFVNDGDFKADNHNYVKARNYQVELYTKTKDQTREKQVEDLLDSLRLPYGKVETRIESEDLYQVVYLIQIIGG